MHIAQTALLSVFSIFFAAAAESQVGERALSLSDLVDLAAQTDFPPLSDDWQPQLTPHPNARSENWSIVAHLANTEESLIGIEVAFSRFGLKPSSDTNFELSSVFRAHAVVLSEGDVASEERLSRGLKTAQFSDRSLEIDNWSVGFHGTEELTLSLPYSDRNLTLSLDADVAAALATGDNGDSPVRGYSLPSIPVQATLDGEEFVGRATLDHHWGDVAFSESPVTFDRVSVQLVSGETLSLVRTRRVDGIGVEILEGNFVDRSGVVVSIEDGAILLTDSGLSGFGFELAMTPLADVSPDFLVPHRARFYRVAGAYQGADVVGSAIVTSLAQN